MESGRIFVDTNLFLYAASMAPEDAGKKAIAGEVIRNPGLVISSQVIQEFIRTSAVRWLF